MWVALLEFFLWVMLGLIAGFAAHWWKSNADPYPDVIDKDRPLMNMALTEYSVTNYALDHEYDEAGFWDYYSLRNLAFYLTGGVGSVLLAVYATAEGHAIARESICKAVGVVGLMPVFCP